MKVTLEGSELVIRIPANTTDPKPSASGKTLLVASTAGSIRTDLMVKNKVLTINLSAYIKN